MAYVYAVSGGAASSAECNYAGTGAFTSNRTLSNTSPGAPSEWVHIGCVRCRLCARRIGFSTTCRTVCT